MTPTCKIVRSGEDAAILNRVNIETSSLHHFATTLRGHSKGFYITYFRFPKMTNFGGEGKTEILMNKLIYHIKGCKVSIFSNDPLKS